MKSLDRGPSSAGTSQPDVSEGAGRVVMLSADRIVYAGPNGSAPRRTLGSLVVYVAIETPFRISVEGRSWERAEIAVVQPYVLHDIRTDDQIIGAVNLEPETFDPRRLPEFLSRSGPCARPDVATRARQALGRLRRAEFGRDPSGTDVDALFFGQAIEQRKLDPRVSAIIDRIKQRPAARIDAETCAELAGVSVSRFLHLFGRETGITFRRFRAWKRARNMLAYMGTPRNLAEFALEAGYPDSTHFSHSIRNVYGLCPREIFSFGRRIAVHVM